MAAAVVGPPARDPPPPNASPSSPLPCSSKSLSPSSVAAADSSPNSEDMEQSSPNSASKNEGVAPARGISVRRLPPPCWTQEETDALIRMYREKWYALRRGNLRAPHWEEVAEAVAARCRHLYAGSGAHSPKTAVQCRHKMEKLRKRYRSEKKRPHRTSWVHFREMDAMETGTPGGTVNGATSGAVPRPKGAGTAPFVEAFSDEDSEHGESDEDGDDYEGYDGHGPKNGGNPGARGIHGLVSMANGGDRRFQIPKAVRTKAGIARVDEWPIPRPHRAGGSDEYIKGFPGGLSRKPAPMAAAEVRKAIEDRRRKEREPAVLEEMAAAVRMLGDGFLRVEEMKMEMAKEMEKLRMDMELKRTEMLLESQRWIIDACLEGISHESKKKRKKPEISHSSR